MGPAFRVSAHVSDYGRSCAPGLKYKSLATPTLCSPDAVPGSTSSGLCAACERRCARLVSASKPSGLSVLSGSEWSFGDGGPSSAGVRPLSRCVSEGPCECVLWLDGEYCAWGREG